MIQLLFNTVQQFLIKLNIGSPGNPAICSQYFPKWVETLHSLKILYTNSYRSFIHNFIQKLEATKMSFNKWMDKHSIVHPNYQLSSKYKKKWATKSQKRWRKFKCINERSQSEKATYGIIITIWCFWKCRTIKTLKTPMVSCLELSSHLPISPGLREVHISLF
jgi:hypothetical protein